ncbi:hypothetical protein AMK59_3513 [Oryctes borbonicus]|uniref:Protein FAM98A n=1 Tax=Oryctes borbonicus TaxID=1629725 RepID=A0A0T6B6D7_9SCAR|nr:hypothetical protein AMK59_3513 [Oryctes borbonicus]
MTDNIIKSLEDIGYSGTQLDQAKLESALNDGPKSILYTEIVTFLTNELKVLCKIDERVNKIDAPEDSVSFLMELSSFLKELGCPHVNLTQGHISDRLGDVNATTSLLDYLITELMAARILHDTKPDTNKIELKVKETPQAANMKKILTVLRFPKPPANISMQTLFSKLLPTVEGAIKKAGSDVIGTPIFNLTLTDKQWHILNQVLQDLHTEYTIRREMLLKRLDCTIQSFQWSDKMKGKDEMITSVYTEKRKQLRVEPNVSMSDLISAREDLAIIEKTSSASVRRNTKSAINRVIIGNVPDRGGRTNELAPPPPEMPSWQQRATGPPQGGGGRGGGYGGRGRGDYSKGEGMQSSSNYSNYSRGGGGGGGYNDRGNDYNRGGGNDYNRGNDYNKGGGSDYNRGGGSDYNRGGNDYNRGGNDYSRGSGTDYNRGSGGNDYNRGSGSDYNRASGGNEYNRGASDYSRGGSGYNRGGGSGYNRGGGSGTYGSDRGSSQNYSQKSGNYVGFDSAGSYGGYQDYSSNEPKRAKTYDYFQNQKTTYADQYVQESQHNQQYQPKRGGRSGYNRGGGGGGSARY